jgi:hypothetical protein
VHTDRSDDVLTHKRLLEEVKLSEIREPAFHVRAVPVLDNGTPEHFTSIVFPNVSALTKASDLAVSLLVPTCRCESLRLSMQIT